MSFDTDDLSAWQPADEAFALGIRLVAGATGTEVEETFDITLCSPPWVATRTRADFIFDPRHHLVVDHYDYPRIEAYLRNKVESCEGSTWNEIAARLAQLGHWEFEDYTEQHEERAGV